MATFAAGRRAFGFCDRCGFRCDYSDLTDQGSAGKLTGLLVCTECVDKDNEQLLLGKIRFSDPIALLNPRPDTGQTASRALSSFPIVGSGRVFNGQPIGFGINSSVGNVEVSTS